jgi:hypothetical protein
MARLILPAEFALRIGFSYMRGWTDDPKGPEHPGNETFPVAFSDPFSKACATGALGSVCLWTRRRLGQPGGKLQGRQETDSPSDSTAGTDSPETHHQLILLCGSPCPHDPEEG